MTEPTTTVYPYPQSKLRIQASYREPRVGDVAPGGTPESIDIEVNDSVPASPDALGELIISVVAALRATDDDAVQIDITNPTSSGSVLKSLPALAQGGRL
jgi:hypothetical protein